MPVLSPVSWVLVIAAFLQCATGFGWWITSKQLDHVQDKLVRCNADYNTFRAGVAEQGRFAAEKAKRIEAEQKRIADETAQGWAKALDYVRADAARRVRLSTNSGGSGLSQTATTGLTTTATDPDAIPAPAQLAADCAETTLTANALQTYIERMQRE